MDHYPGGWQVNLPIAGFGYEFDGNSYGLHGETALIPWESTITKNDETGATLRLETDLLRYPFHVDRKLHLPARESRLEITESVTNEGDVELEYIWQQHVALGEPLLSPEARLDCPATGGVVEEASETFRNGRLEFGAEFEWPEAPRRDGSTADLREIPPPDAGYHDQAYLTGLESEWYALTNPDLNLGFGLTFPTDPFECIWYWQALGGYHESPYFSRNYNVGLEPTTAYPGGDIPEAQRVNDTMKTLEPGETVSAEFTAITYSGCERVTGIDPAGEVYGE